MEELTTMEKDLVRRFTKSKRDEHIKLDPDEYQGLIGLAVKTGLTNRDHSGLSGMTKIGDHGWSSVSCKTEYASALKPLFKDEESRYSKFQLEFKKDTDYPITLPAGASGIADWRDMVGSGITMFPISNDYLYNTKTKADRLPQVILNIRSFERYLPWTYDKAKKMADNGENEVRQSCYSGTPGHRCGGFDLSHVKPDTPVKLIRRNNKAAWHILCPGCQRVWHTLWVGDSFTRLSNSVAFVEGMNGYRSTCRYVNFMLPYGGMVAHYMVGNNSRRSKWSMHTESGSPLPMGMYERYNSHMLSYLLAEDAIRDASEKGMEIIAGKQAEELINREN